MPHEPVTRLDQWLWAVRAFKTRSLAVAAIKDGRVSVNGRAAKPSHAMRVGELVVVGLGQGAARWIRTLKVLGCPASRVGAPMVSQFATDLTPAEELEKSKSRDPHFSALRPQGMGRPTKRDRREIDRLGL